MGYISKPSGSISVTMASDATAAIWIAYAKEISATSVIHSMPGQ